jgi:alkanesulfonate monooxygenase SsuD/methylene tetrahydromethanopterin reductase-like flavin-dependent oxidoreductase (luciferase family)
MRIGVLLPHFGSAAQSPELFDRALEAIGECRLQSAWVRDHLVYQPHGMEDPDPTFLEAFSTLAYAGSQVPASTTLGTAAAIPLRHPLLLAKIVASITHLTRRRFVLGIGAGFRDTEAEAAGYPSTFQLRVNTIIPETLEIVRNAWRPGTFSYSGQYFSFGEVEIFPKPLVAPEIWFCGTSPRAMRTARDTCDGWVPGRITFSTLEERRTRSELAGKSVAVIPVLSIAESRQQARQQIDLDRLLEYANRHRWLVKPPGRQFETADDLEGLLLAGTPDDFTEALRRYQEHGVTDVILDFRLRPQSLPRTMELLRPILAPSEADQ